MRRKPQRTQKPQTTNSQKGMAGRPKSQETLELEEKVKKEGIEPASSEGKKRITRLRRELKAAQAGRALGKAGRPKSPQTLMLEELVTKEGLDSASTEGRRLLGRLRRAL